MTRRLAELLPLVALAGVWAAACHPAPPPAEPVVQHETPSDAILRIGRVWQSSQQDKGFRSPPSKLSVSDISVQSKITIRDDRKHGDEEIAVEERYQLRDGGHVECEAHARSVLDLHFGRHHGEPAVEFVRPRPPQLTRRCTSDRAPPAPDVGFSRGRFVLRDDQLAPFGDALDKRVYLPIQ